MILSGEEKMDEENGDKRKDNTAEKDLDRKRESEVRLVLEIRIPIGFHLMGGFVSQLSRCVNVNVARTGER